MARFAARIAICSPALKIAGASGVTGLNAVQHAIPATILHSSQFTKTRHMEELTVRPQITQFETTAATRSRALRLVSVAGGPGQSAALVAAAAAGARHLLLHRLRYMEVLNVWRRMARSAVKPAISTTAPSTA